MERKTMKVKVGQSELIFETGAIARQANGAVVVHCGETTVFSSACASFKAGDLPDFFPLRVDYQEKFSAAGKTLGGFLKREGRPAQREILMCRLIDRPIRPMFENGYLNDTQILSYVWSYDGINQPEPLAICAATAALVISDIPFIKPVAGVRVGMINGEFIINPTTEQLEQSTLELLMAGTKDAVTMIEGCCDFLTEQQVIDAIYAGHEAIREICVAMDSWRQEIGKPKRRDTIHVTPQEVIDAVEALGKPLFSQAVRIVNKKEREKAFDEAKKSIIEKLIPEGEEEHPYEPADVAAAIKQVSSGVMREMVLSEQVRCDGRSPTDIRPIDIEVGVLPRTHGSALFTRGETQALAVCTLGGDSMAQRYETLDDETSWRFYLQYSFPPFSVGEVGRSGPPGRREIGHGKLAEKAIEPVLPSEGDFPYVMRLESNITESNGSSSMASVCGGCLALMDAGVPISKPVSGIAMGLVLEDDGRYTILSDILGVEDALGDMDFKITGDAEGITAFQMDIKVEGITPNIMHAALQQAKAGRVHILEKMTAVMPKPRAELPAHAPRIEMIKVHPSKIGAIIGPGGKMIRAITEETGVTIDIDDDGTVKIGSPNLEAIQKARASIEGLIAEIETGKVYTGKITSIVPFGMFIEVLPGKEGLCHISEYSYERVENLDDLVKVGEEVTVKALEVNDRGQVRLSRKALLEKPEGYVEPPARERGSRDRGGHDRGGRDRGGRKPHHEGSRRR